MTTSPNIPSLDDIAAAHELIAPHVRRTPVIDPDGRTLGLDHDVVLKLELLQHTGSFKPRGAFHRALRNQVGDAGLIAASGGNHGAAVAFVASRLGVPAEIFVPGVSPLVKRQRIADLGATVHVVGEFYDDAQAACDERAAQTGAFQIHPFDHVESVAGQATVASELLDDVPDIDTIIVAAGGGGLAAGIAARCRGQVRVIVVEPVGSRAIGAALDAGYPTPVIVDSIAADSLGARQVGAAPYASLRAFATDAVTVTDDAITDAQRRCWAALRLVVEAGGAAALAALTSGVYVPERNERVAVIVCGSNTDPMLVTPSDQR